jgi:hypothetical protein
MPNKPEAVTDADGRFRLEGIGADRLLIVSVQGTTAAYDSFYVITRSLTPINWRWGGPSPYFEQVYGANFTHATQPTRPIRGVVRDVATSEPLVGVAIQSLSFPVTTVGGARVLKTTTGEQGRFELLGMPKGERNRILVVPNDEQPYFMREINVPSPPGIGPVELTIDLHRGQWITGRVTDKVNGKPVKGARLHYLPFLTNKFAQALPEFDGGNVDGEQWRYATNENGEYRLVGLPGPAVVGVGMSDEVREYRRGVGYEEIAATYGKNEEENGRLKTWRNPVEPGPMWPLSMAAINPADGVKHVMLDFELDPGLRVPVEVRDGAGRPIPGVKVAGRSSFDNNEKLGSRFDIINLGPSELRTVIVRHDKLGLGKVIQVTPQSAKDGPLSIRLEPLTTITGRVVDPDGTPVAAADILPGLPPGGDFSLRLRGGETDADGRFRVENVPVGCEYTLLVLPPASAEDRLASETVSVKPRETIDIGNVALKRR